MELHSDQSSDHIRAAKDSPPLCGRPGEAAGGIGRLDRTTGPAFAALLAGHLPRPIPTISPSGS